MTGHSGDTAGAGHSGVVSPAKFAHVVLRTTRIADMVAWYTNVLGMQVSYQNPMISFLTYDDEHHRVAILNVTDLKPKVEGTTGVDHVAFTYSTLADLLGNHERLKAQGVVPFWSINHGPTMSIYYRDPDNNQVELQVDNFDTTQEASAFFASPDFDSNPVGVEFDPSDLNARLLAGEEEGALKRRPAAAVRTLDRLPLR